MRIRYSGGSSAYAWIMSLDGALMRVAVKDSDDAQEFRFERGNWVSEDGATVTFEFPWPLGGASAFLAGVEHITSDSSVTQACGGTGHCVLRVLIRGN